MNPEEAVARSQLSEQEKAPKFKRFSLRKGGHEVAFAEVDEFKKPFRFYYVARVVVNPEYQGKGYGSQIMSAVESFLKRKGSPGILIDTVESDSPASGMYVRRGWKPFFAPAAQCLYVFNRGFRTDKQLAEAATQLSA